MRISVGEWEEETFAIEVKRWNLFAIKAGEYIDFLVWRRTAVKDMPWIVENEIDEIRRQCFKDYQLSGRGWEITGTRITLKGIQKRRAYKKECRALKIRPETFGRWVVDEDAREKRIHQHDIERRLRILAAA